MERKHMFSLGAGTGRQERFFWRNHAQQMHNAQCINTSMRFVLSSCCIVTSITVRTLMSRILETRSLRGHSTYWR